jgi:hypothetical protein
MQFVTPFLIKKITLASLFEKLILPVYDLGDPLKAAKEQGHRRREVDQQIGVCFRHHVVTRSEAVWMYVASPCVYAFSASRQASTDRCAGS